jgi:hypothetical protein
MRRFSWGTLVKVIGAVAALLVALVGLFNAVRGPRDASPSPSTVQNSTAGNRASLINTYWQGKKVYESHWFESDRDEPLRVWFYNGGYAQVQTGYTSRPTTAQCIWVGDEDPGVVRITCDTQIDSASNTGVYAVVYELNRAGLKMKGVWKSPYKDDEERCSLERAQ